jgi:hypothetical protein
LNKRSVLLCQWRGRDEGRTDDCRGSEDGFDKRKHGGGGGGGAGGVVVAAAVVAKAIVVDEAKIDVLMQRARRRERMLMDETRSRSNVGEKNGSERLKKV